MSDIEARRNMTDNILAQAFERIERLEADVAELRHSANVAERMALSICAGELAAIEARAVASLALIEDDAAMRFVLETARRGLAAVDVVGK